MMVDVVVEMDDIDMLALIEMARDKLTRSRITRSQAGAKRKSGRPGGFAKE